MIRYVILLLYTIKSLYDFKKGFKMAITDIVIHSCIISVLRNAFYHSNHSNQCAILLIINTLYIY